MILQNYQTVYQKRLKNQIFSQPPTENGNEDCREQERKDSEIIKNYKSLRELFENEWFPKTNAIGISWDEFWHMNPDIINLMIKGHQEKIKQQDYFA